MPLIKPMSAIPIIKGREFWTSPDPDLKSATIKGGPMITWLAWACGGGLKDGVTAETIAGMRGMNPRSIRKQLQKAVDEQTDLKALIPARSGDRYRVVIRLANPVGSGRIPAPTHAGEFIRCRKCKTFGRYLGVSDKTGLAIYAHGVGRGGLAGDYTLCRVKPSAEGNSEWDIGDETLFDFADMEEGVVIKDGQVISRRDGVE